MFLKKLVLSTFLFGLFGSQLNYSQTLQVGGGGIYLFENATVKGGMGYQFNLIYRAQKRIAILASVGHYKEPSPEWKSIYTGPSVNGYPFRFENALLPGDFSLTWIELSPIYYLFENSVSKLSVYAGASFGVYYPETKWNWETYYNLLSRQEQEGFFYNESKIGPKLGFNIRSGLDISITNKSRINLELKYVLYQPEIHYEINTQESLDTEKGAREINLNTFSVGVSLMVIL